MVDAEGLMPLPSSDFRNPICLEMKLLREGVLASSSYLPQSDITPGGGISRNEFAGSVDSSDTYASCNTQPFNSQGDLVGDTSNLYINPMNEDTPSGVKKSASGDPCLLLGGDDIAFGEWTSSRTSLGDQGTSIDMVPKHRKTRFQQQSYFDDDRNSQDSLDKKKKLGFMPTKSLATATRLINQHLFGLPSLGKSSFKGKNGESRSSLSVDSIDSRGLGGTPELPRRSKSILKKSDHNQSSPMQANHRSKRDPETEKLIQDTDLSFGRTITSGSYHLGDLYICPPPPPMEQTSPTEETRLLSKQNTVS